MKNNYLLVLAFMTFAYQTSLAQIGIGTTTPDSSSILDVSSTSKGFLLPRLTTTQRSSISSPAKGLAIYNTTTSQLETYNGTAWIGPALGTVTSVTGTSPISVTNGTTTPTISISAIPMSKLSATGTASATTYLRGDGTWATPSGGGTATTASNGLTVASGDVKLGGTLTTATTIDQNNTNLTFTTGTGRTIINGSLENNGANFVKLTTVSSATYTVTATDNFILFNGSSNSVFTLPSPSSNTGRIIRIVNSAPGNYQITFPANTLNTWCSITTVESGYANTFICDGTYWYPLAQ